MNEPSLQQLERDVETTRARLARNLDTLRSPTARAEFTEALGKEAVAVKDDLVERTRSAAQTRVTGWIDDLKARAAENPAAVLAIAAGIGWRLLRNPPVSTALIGVGLFSLLRSDAPARIGLDDKVYVDAAVGNLKRQSRRVVDDVVDRAKVATAATGDTLREWSGEAVTAVQDAGARVLDTAQEAAAVASEGLDASRRASQEAITRAAEGAGQAVAELRRSVRDRVPDPAGEWLDIATDAAALGQRRDTTSPDDDRPQRSDTVDQLLLGAAGAAVAAAIGVALQRRMSAEARAE
jgi:hypothetical protein